jgi:N-acetylglucosamine-6-sulfatase
VLGDRKFLTKSYARPHLLRWRPTRRARQAGALLFSIGLLAVLIVKESKLLSGATQMAAVQPNIVVIMTDDQTAKSIRFMPKTLALIGKRGTTFSNSFVSHPWCCPSRATCLTGQYPHNHDIWNSKLPRGGYAKLDPTNTLPVWLQQAGYYTSHIGKYVNGYGLDDPTEVPPGWGHWQGLVDPSTYRMYDYTINDNGTLVHYGKAPQDYQTDVLATRAEQTIEEAVRLNQPFFISIAPVAPHAELIENMPGPRAAPRDLGAFAKQPLPRPPSFNERDVSDKPRQIRILPLLDKSAVKEITDRYRNRLASLLAVDDLVARVVRKLAATGVLNNTVIIFTSDNGFFQGEHRIPNEKEKVYEESVRVPLLIRGGGFPIGATASQVVANVDLAPTIVQLAGAIPHFMEVDGRPLLPLARDPKLGVHRDLLIETLTYEAVRNESFVYAEYKTGERELYDLRRGAVNYDPFELQSRHTASAYAGIKARLAAELDRLRTCSGMSCRM